MSKTRVRKRLESWWRGQWLSNDKVVPHQKYDPLHKRMYFDSPAGHIEVRFGTREQVAPFRDKFANRFDQCVEFKEFNQLYNEMLNYKQKGIKVIKHANIHTRLKGKLCNLLIFL